MAWSSAVFGIVGTVVGAAVSPLLQLRSARRARLEDAYIDLAGAATLLVRLSIESLAGKVDRTDEAWVRYGAARARVLLQDEDPECHREVVALDEELERLHAIRATPGPAAPTPAAAAPAALGPGPAAPAAGETVPPSGEHAAQMKRVEKQIDKLLHCARRQMRIRLLH